MEAIGSPNRDIAEWEILGFLCGPQDPEAAHPASEEGLGWWVSGLHAGLLFVGRRSTSLIDG